MNYEIKLGKVTFDFNYDKWQDNYLGQCQFKIDSYFIRKMLKDYNELPYIDVEGLYSVFENDAELTQEQLKYDTVQLSNVDFLISFLDYAHNTRFSKKLEIKYYGLTPFWIYHDYLHSFNDVYGGRVEVNQYIEKERLEQVFKNKKWIANCELTEEYINQIEEGYYNRWGVPLNSDIIKKYKQKNFEYEDILIVKDNNL